MKTMKVRDMIKKLRKEGWILDRVRGDHRQFVHPINPETVTVAGHPSVDLNLDTLNSILKQAGLRK